MIDRLYLAYVGNEYLVYCGLSKNEMHHTYGDDEC